MSTQARVFFDHSRHKLQLEGDAVVLDVLTFSGEEHLSQPFKYCIEFTCTELDLAAERLLNHDASFSLYAATHPALAPLVESPPLRRRHGVITHFKRLSVSNDEARYEVTLEPRLALLGRGKQVRIYQQQSVPEIVKSILRGRHDLADWEFVFDLLHEYPRREQVMQYAESDLAFISRLLAEVGIWYRFNNDEEMSRDIIEFHDHQRFYQYDIELPHCPPAGLNTDEDGVWSLQTHHQVVEKSVSVRSYDYRDAGVLLDGEIDQVNGIIEQTEQRLTSAYGEAHHYGEPYTALGDPYAWVEDLQPESGVFFARLRHEHYLNDQTRLTGATSSATLAPGQMLTIARSVPHAFAEGAVIVHVKLHAARDRSLEVSFAAIPYLNSICFRPPLLPKPSMAGTLPARVTSPQTDRAYADLDRQGRYKVKFLCDRDTWAPGMESKWLRLARPYAGATHGLHLPLLPGTEVAIAFEQGDPDRPYIAHALHDSKHLDHVTLKNEKRNVLRTPANNKLRMEDERGKEHVKLSTDFAGKSQLNLGHVVDAGRRKRGEGFELRTDAKGAIRAGDGLFISAQKQPAAQGLVLDMAAAIGQLEDALSLARSLDYAVRSAESKPGDIDSQESLFKALTELAQPGMLLHAPAGIAVTSPQALCLASGSASVAVVAGLNTDLTAGRDITASACGGVRVYAKEEGIQLTASAGKIGLQALNSTLEATASEDLTIRSLNGRVEISAGQELVLKCGGAYIRLKDGEIEVGAPGNLYLKTAHVQKLGSARLDRPPVRVAGGYSGKYLLHRGDQRPFPFAQYRITTPQGEVFTGVTDKEGKTMAVHTLLPGQLEIESTQEAKPIDEQLRITGPEGESAAHLKYVIELADGSVQAGKTDAQGHTQRIVTLVPTQLVKLTLMPPSNVPAACCAAPDTEVGFEVDLESRELTTSDDGSGVSVVTIALAKGKKRKFTIGEIEMARKIFGDSIRYKDVRIHHGDWWLFTGTQNTAVTPNGDIYLPARTELYKDDFSVNKNREYISLFMHEMTHVWQHQMGYSVKWHGMTVSSKGIEAYRYELSSDLKLADFNMEQQGEIISDYFCICILGEPSLVWNAINSTKDPIALASTLEGFLNDPHNSAHLPR
jgi:Rhs element Vgr protein